MGLREAFLARAKRKVEAIDVPDLGERAYVRTITVGERNKWADIRYRALVDGLNVALMAESRVYLVSVSLCDGDGEPLFNEEEAAALDPHTVDFVANEAERVNGLTDEAKEDVEGNSEAPQAD